MATGCFLPGCEERANTDNGGKIPLILTNQVYSYLPKAVGDLEGRKTFRERVYFCCPGHMFDYLLSVGVVSKEEREGKAGPARDESKWTQRELAELREKKRKKEAAKRREERERIALEEDGELLSGRKAEQGPDEFELVL